MTISFFWTTYIELIFQAGPARHEIYTDENTNVATPYIVTIGIEQKFSFASKCYEWPSGSKISVLRATYLT